MEALDPVTGVRGGRSFPAVLRRPAFRWLLRITLAAAALAGGLAIIGRRMPGVDDVASSLRSGEPRWLVVAALLEVASIAGFGAQERMLMRAMGVPMRLPKAVALAGAQAAIAMALPAGSAVSTGFTLRQLRRIGGRTDVAVTTVLLSGVASVLGLLIPYLATVAVTVSGSLRTPASAAAAGAVLIGCGTVALTWWLPGVVGKRIDRSIPSPPAPAAPGLWRRLTRSRQVARDAFDAMRSISPFTWYATVALATVNWSADMLCLAALGSAFHVKVDAWALAVGYLGVQVGRFVSFGSGGVGVVEPALLAVLVASGVPAAPAAAVVVAYRLLSCWLVILAGLPVAAVLYQSDRRSQAAPVSPAIPEQSRSEPAAPDARERTH